MNTTDFEQSIKRLLELATPGLITSGIFLKPGTWEKDLINLCDGTYSRPITQEQWGQMYFDLFNSALPGTALKATSEVKARVKHVQAQGMVPIGIADLIYHQLMSRFEGVLRAKYSSGEAVPIPDHPEAVFEEKRAFFAAPLLLDIYRQFNRLPYVHWGKHVLFLMDSELYLSNTDARPHRIEIDPDDGGGFREVSHGDILEVHYQQPSIKTLTIKAYLPDAVFTSSSVFNVAEPLSIPDPDQTFDLKGVIQRKGVYHEGKASIYYGYTDDVKHTDLINPIIVADAFPGHPDVKYLYQVFNQHDTMDEVLLGGYDVVFVQYKDDQGRGYIELNAGVVIDCIQKIISGRESVQLVVGGASMGGLVTRYALAYMEANNLTHQTKLFFTLDTPNHGAYIPISLQWSITLMAAGGQTDAEALADLLHSPAARQMMFYNVKDYISGDYESDLWNNFWQDLENQNGGYPGKPYKIAIANGSGDGGQVIDPDSQILYAGDKTSSFYIDLKADPYTSSEEREVAYGFMGFFSRIEGKMLVRNILPYSDGPGGQENSIKQLYDALVRYTRAHKTYDSHCFIPTSSALDLDMPASKIFDPVMGYTSPFNDTWYSTTNLPHVTITPEIKQYILKQLGITPSGLTFGDQNSYPWAETSGVPAIAATSKYLYLAFRGASEHDGGYYIYWDRYGTAWQNQQNHKKVSRDGSAIKANNSPSLTVMNDLLYLAYVDTKHEIKVLSFNEETQTWSRIENSKLPDCHTETIVGLSYVGDKLYVAYIGPNTSRIFYQYRDTSGQWSGEKQIGDGDQYQASDGLALVNAGGVLYLFYRQKSAENVYFHYLPEGQSRWSDGYMFEDYRSSKSVGATYFNGRIEMMCRDSDGEVLYAFNPSINRDPLIGWIPFQFDAGWKAGNALSLAGYKYDEQYGVYVAYTGNGEDSKKMYWRVGLADAQLRAKSVRND